MKFQPPKGTRDFLPEVSRKYQFVIEVIRSVFERYGFTPLDTPAFENFELLATKGGESIKNEIYYFKDKSGRELGLRFDFTLGLTRFVTNNPAIPKPFKAYQIGKVWRYDQPQAMRWREFWQADADIIGVSSPKADAECLAAAVECLEKLGIKDFSIRVNDRKLIEKLIKETGVKENIPDIFRAIDKLDKIGVDGVKKELGQKGVNANKVLKILEMKNRDSPELKELLNIAGKLGIKKRLKVDPSLVRGLDYYTGLVFEIMIGKAKVSCGGGGRYDGLIKTLGGPNTPATGISFGVDRIVALMEEKKLFGKNPDERYYVATVNDSVKPEVIKIVQKLRKKGKIVDFDLMDRNLNKQLQYTNKTNIPKVIIIGPSELRQNKVVLKDMKTGKEKKIKINEL